MKKFTMMVALAATMGWGATNAFAVCGDNTVDAIDGDSDGACEEFEGCEQCDDGNVVDGDGCSSTCRFECTFNTPGKTKGTKADLVRAFAECPSTQHSGGFTPGATAPTCSPAKIKATGNDTATDYLFGEKKGTCIFATKPKALKDCSAAKDASGAVLGIEVQDACSELGVSLKCKGIVQANGDTPINATQDAGWSLFTLTRATTLDSNIGSGTVIDFPVTFNIPTSGMEKPGELAITVTSTQALFGIFGSTTALSECTSLEIVDVGLLAPGGKPFGRMGTSTRPKSSIGLGGSPL
jgi:cysteine-rich repeat protein